jgi:hypothetical protein
MLIALPMQHLEASTSHCYVIRTFLALFFTWFVSLWTPVRDWTMERNVECLHFSIFFMAACISTCVGFKLLFLWVCRKSETNRQTDSAVCYDELRSLRKQKFCTPTQRCPFRLWRLILWINRGVAVNLTSAAVYSLKLTLRRYFHSAKSGSRNIRDFLLFKWGRS